MSQNYRRDNRHNHAVTAPVAVLEMKPDRPVPRKTFTPIRDLIAVHTWEQRETPSGLVVAGQKDVGLETVRALVIACGPECKSVKEGDIVLVSGEVVAAIIKHRKQESLVMQEIQVLGIELPEEKQDESPNQVQATVQS